MSYQRVIIQGNLTRDAESRQVGNSTVAKFSVATSERYKKTDGSYAEDVEYHDIELWNQPGVIPYLVKGQAVIVEGKIKTDRWQDQQGQTHERKGIRANLVNLCGPRPQAQAPAPAPAPAPQYPQQPVYQQAPPAPSWAQRYPAPEPPQYPQAPAPQYARPQAQASAALAQEPEPYPGDLPL